MTKMSGTGIPSLRIAVIGAGLIGRKHIEVLRSGV